MNIAVIGTGYVGLVTGTCFAETGNHVVCVDIDVDKVNRMQNGEVPIFEPGLELLFDRNTKQERLFFTTELKDAVPQADVVFLALPTPPGEDGSADLSYVLKAAGDAAKYVKKYTVFVDKSTVPVGTSELVSAHLEKHLSKELFDVVSNPEFLREGVAVDDFMKPDRVVIGTDSEKARQLMSRLYAPFVRQGNPVIFMDKRSSEMTKYAANAYLATRITFMNEIANLCEKLGANVDKVRLGMGSDNRIGKRFLFPGVGYGGSCFPKDVQALSKMADKSDYDFSILKAVMEKNDEQKLRLIDKVKAFYSQDLKGKVFALWGLAFKPNTDDIREAPALYMIEELLKAGATVKAFDPEAMDNVARLMGSKIELVNSKYDALKDADALLIATEWNIFRTPDFDELKSLLKAPVIFDGRNLFDLEEMDGKGIHYESIGRATINIS